ncbi:MAG TPA: geranylgeranyl reductase family protein [Chloroflexota bacterium]|jgi:geranylgeranyl reductase family protein|nr:geranylgeranyl reductase family protein [Chloroflexota bacterium]
MPTPSYDAVVVGAGPGGSFAARRLAQRGARVLLLERKTIPREKPCGGGLTPKAYRQLDFPIDDLVLSRPPGVWLRGHGVPAFPLADPRSEIWMVRRPAFDRRLAERAAAAGADLHDGESVLAVDPEAASVRTDRGEYRAGAVVAADGSESPIARQLGLRPRRDRRVVVALEAEVPARDVALHGRALVDFDVPHGYAWVFPKGELYNVGLGSFQPSAFRELRPRLARFLDRCGLELLAEPKVVGHRIPIGGLAEPLHRGRVVLVGDAAGVADGLFAEGIAYALRTGALAADEVGRLLDGRRPDLGGYTRRVQTTLLRDLRAWRAIGAIVYRFPSLSMRLLKASRLAQHLAAATIAGDRSLSKAWPRATF